MAYVSGTPAGYFELERQHDAAVELASLGLLPRFIGKGIGGTLLTAAITRAWEMGTQRVWVHTCTLDHPQALSNDQARGFRIVRREEMVEELPNEPLQPWPGATVTFEDRDASHHLIVDMQHDFGTKGGMFERAGIDLSMMQQAVGPTASVLAAARQMGIPTVYLKMGFRPDLSDLGPADPPNRLRHLRFGVGETIRAPETPTVGC
jgi:hypothetical protein